MNPTFDLTTVAGIAAATVIVVQIILTAAAPSDAASSRWGPLLAVGIGVLLSVGQAASAGTFSGSTALAVVLLGVAAGAMAMGGHNVLTKSAVGTTVAAGLGLGAGAAVRASKSAGDGSGR